MSAAATGPRKGAAPRVVALAGGVGAARFLRGLVRAVPPEHVTIVVNTGDDREFYGVHVSPDIDIVTYTLAGAVHPERGYGLAGDTTNVVDALAPLGHETWFRLGDRDLATSLHRTQALRAGVGLAEISDQVRRAFGVASRILPMSEDACPTYVELSGGRRIHFEEYLARDGAPDDVESVDLSAARAATPGPGVLEAIGNADVIVVCPSNPVVSIGPILAVPGVEAAVREARAPVVAVSPIIGGAPVKGPADRLLRGTGAEVSALGVARLYREFCDAYVFDSRDRVQLGDITALGLRAAATETLMRDAQIAQALAETALDLATRTVGAAR